MSSSVFTEAPSARPAAVDAASNLVVVYGKNGVSFDDRAIENIMEEKSISTISVVRLTSPTPSMMEQEELERLEEMQRFLEQPTDSELDSDNDSQSDGGDSDAKSLGDTSEDEKRNTSDEDDADSSETEADAPRSKRRPGRKPKAVKKRKRRKPRERPQVVGLRVEQFYADLTADMVVKNALKLAGVPVYKRTPETDALLEVIRNDHNYTPFTSPEQLKNHKRAEKVAMETQAQNRKIIMQAPGSVKLLNAKKRVPTMPFSPLQVRVQRLPTKPPQPSQPLHPAQVQLLRKPGGQHALPRRNPEITANSIHHHLRRGGPDRVPVTVKIIKAAEEHIEDDEDAQSSDAADEENADKSYDTEEPSEESDEFLESDNDRDSDIDFNMRHGGGRSTSKRKRVKKAVKPAPAAVRPTKPTPTPMPTKPTPTPRSNTPHFPELKRRKEPPEPKAPLIGQIIQLAPKAPPGVIALGRNLPSTSFLKTRPPAHQVLAVKKPLLPGGTLPGSSAAKMRRTPVVQVCIFSPQEVKEIIINKNTASPKGVFTNLNSLLGDNNNASFKASPDPQRPRQIMSPSTPRSSFSTPQAVSAPVKSSTPLPCKGFMPISVNTAQSHKLPAQIVIETHQSSSELAAENDKQLDLINSIVQDELLKTTLVDQHPVNADESIPKLAKMLESSAASLDPAAVNFDTPVIEGANSDVVEPIDEDEITADFLQHVVGLIEEDKQFEAEVVKQVLASTEPGTLDAIAALPTPVTSVTSVTHPQPMAVLPQTILPANSIPVEAAPAITSAHQPIACSTPTRIMVTPEGQSAKVIRGNGRVIYLPPIEAPTTRAKRRAQFPATSASAGNLSLNESTLETSIGQLANTSTLSNDSQSGMGPRRSNPREPSLARRSTVPRRSKKLNMDSSNDPEASESQEDDDDPNKLWCICRQPHNNRFMICCDKCEDWFHGNCVNVTKAMGTEMEQKGIDWKCPECVKKLEAKTQPRITEMLIAKPAFAGEAKPNEAKVFTVGANSTQAAPPGEPKRVLQVGVPVSKAPLRSPMIKPSVKRPIGGTFLHHQQQLNFIKLGPSPGNRTADVQCVVCKRPASGNSVYCGEECIRKYAQNAIQASSAAKSPDSPSPQNAQSNASAIDAKRNKKKDLFEDMLRQADSMSKVERINVFERKSGRVIVGHLAPAAHQFRKWLQENPTFEVLPSGTLQSADSEKRPPKPLSQVSSAHETSVLAGLDLASPDIKKPFQVIYKPPATPISSARSLPKKDKEKEKEKPATSSIVSAASLNRSASKPEPVRIGIRRSLKEQLLARIKEAQDAAKDSSQKVSTAWPTVAEVEHFARSVESEMFHSFGRDVGAKYKAKYRSLMFNIKDRKNKTLFEKICAKQVEPKQLVRMTPEQLASQELAKWREEENRHQLDMIKKSELDMLYAVKTHKGEEVIDSKVEVSLPDEELSTPPPVEKKPDLDSSSVERSGSKEKSSSSREKRHKSHKHHHRKRSRSRSGSRGRSLEKRHRRHHNDADTSDAQAGEGEQHSPEKHNREAEEVVPPSSTKKREESNASPIVKKPEKPKKKLEGVAYNLIDQILDSEKTVEQAANLEKPTKPTAKPLPTVPPSLDNYGRYVHSLATASLWTGNLKMIEVTDFNVVMHPVMGNTTHLSKVIPSQLNVIGRITRENVWEYIKKLKKSPTKEVVIVNFFPCSTNDTPKFNLFFEYLDSRQRLGVLGVNSEQIRDFYIFPFGSGDVLPPELQPAERVPFYADSQRPNTLLGIIVRCLSKRSLPSVGPSVAASSSTKVRKTRSAVVFTPPSSPKRKASTHSTSSKDEEFDIDAIIKAPIAKLKKSNAKIAVAPVVDEADEPYSPGGSDDEYSAPMPRMPNDLERQMDEINKQIAAQQMEIAGLLKVEPKVRLLLLIQDRFRLNSDSLFPQASASSSKVLAGISIPPNLSKILASIKDKTPGDGDEEYNPEEALTTPRTYGESACRQRPQKDVCNGESFAAGTPKSKGRLARLSEAELLSMVPDGVMASTSKTRQQQPPID
ncbi:hypothetical protein KR018_004466 [Drosophila ironensis]|nr:hypothetical protein KR018_004466 [Drosophila ironensis]